MSASEFPALYRADDGHAIVFVAAFPKENDQVYLSVDGTVFRPVRIIGSGWGLDSIPDYERQQLTVTSDFESQYPPRDAWIVIDRKLGELFITVSDIRYDRQDVVDLSAITFEGMPRGYRITLEAAWGGSIQPPAIRPEPMYPVIKPADGLTGDVATVPATKDITAVTPGLALVLQIIGSAARLADNWVAVSVMLTARAMGYDSAKALVHPGVWMALYFKNPLVQAFGEAELSDLVIIDSNGYAWPTQACVDILTSNR